MKTHVLKQALSDEEASSLAGEFLDDSHYDLILTQDEDCVDEEGNMIVAYRKDAIPLNICNRAYESLRGEKGIFSSDNRGTAGGLSLNPHTGKKSAGFRRVKQDGTISNSTRSPNIIQSGIIGYFDRETRRPFCRQTRFTANRVEKWRNFIPYVREVSRVFKQVNPIRYEAQKGVCNRTSPDFVISDSAFTTVTVNRNWQTAVHTDRGDLPEGFGVLTTFRAGNYRGGLFVIPKYRVAVDMRTGGVMLANVHEWHGNTALQGLRGAYERLSCVFYYRKKMIKCESAKVEGEIARNRGALNA